MSDTDFPDVQTSDPVAGDPNSASGQVLYQMAMGAQPQDFHPALQPLAQGFSPLFQTSPPQTPGLLGSPDAVQQATAQTPPTSAPPSTGADAAPADDGDNSDGDDSDEDDDSEAEDNSDAGQDDDDDDQADDHKDGDDQAPAPAPAPTASDPITRLKDAQDAALGNPRYRSDKGQTHCNQATYDIAQRTGADTAPLGDGKAYLANVQVRNLEAAANTPGSGWKKVELGQAQGYANQGRTTVLGWVDPNGGHGHTVTVRARADGLASNPTLAQIGGNPPGNGEHTFRESFGSSKRKAVRAYVYVGN